MRMLILPGSVKENPLADFVGHFTWKIDCFGNGSEM